MALLLALGALTELQAQTYDQLWKQVQQAKDQGKPQTAIQLSGDIFRKAETEKNSAQMLKAYIQRAELRDQLTPDSFYVNLQNLEQWAETAEKPLDRSVLHTLIAGFYADYASQNQWQLRQRGEVVNEEPSADIREWSGNLFVQQVWTHTRAALKDSKLLLDSSTQAYVPFVTQGTSSAYFKHDMYHLLGSRGIESLSAVQSLDKDTLVKSGIESIYQSLLSAYRQQEADEALVLVSLDYLRWKQVDGLVVPYRTKPGKIGLAQNPYVAELNKLIARYQSKAICAEVYLAKAQYAYENQERVSAVQLCDEALKRYPSYVRINAVKQLKQEILRPCLIVQADCSAYPGEELRLIVNHRNLDGFTVMFYRVNTPDIPMPDTNIDDKFYKDKTSKLSEKHFALARPSDYQLKDTVFTLLSPAEGCYVMRVVPDAKGEKSNGQFLHVTRLAVLSRNFSQNQCEAVVVDSKTGHPVPGAAITLYSADEKPLKTLTADAKGKTRFDWDTKYRNVRAMKGTDKSMPYQWINNYYYRFTTGDRETETVQLLTDRALYRPGQTVYVKGIVYKQQPDTARVITGKSYTLRLYDANRQELTRQSVHTNEFGSFTTSFALPAVCLNGFFTLETDRGSMSIRVEEYKRPTFDITFDKPEGSYRLNDRVQLRGQAKTFSGVPMHDLSVQYTVTRSFAYVWRMSSGGGDRIESGSVPLNADGTFTIPVLLKGPEATEGSFPAYRFQVEATLTNVAGETQSSSYSLTVSERSLFLSTDLDGRIRRDQPISTTFKAVNPDGQPVAVEGTYQLFLRTDAKKDMYAENPTLLGLFTSNKKTDLPGWQTLPSGTYRLVLTAKDAQGREVKDETTLEFFSLSDTRPATETPLWYYEANTQFDATHPAEFYFGTSFGNTYVWMTVLCGETILENRTFVVSDTILRYDYPYQETYGNGITVNFCFFKNNQLYQQSTSLQKRLPEKTLAVKWEVFRDKLRPGQKEEWKLTVKTPQGTPAEAEMLALMYDASLDKIWPYQQNLQLYYGISLPTVNWQQAYPPRNLYYYYGFNSSEWKVPVLVYDQFTGYRYSTPMSRALRMRASGIAPQYNGVVAVADVKGNAKAETLSEVVTLSDMELTSTEEAGQAAGLSETPSGLRTNFSETAFFYPQLRTNEQGEITLSFTLPESLTRWNFRGFAHTKGMLTGNIDSEVTASKEFMLTPNLPRFVRVGDKTSVAASVANLSEQALSGTVDFILFDPMTEQVVSTQRQKFTTEAGQTIGVNFQFTATDKYDVLACRLIADGGTFSDGEQHILPVLSNKQVLTETVGLPVRGQKTCTFSLDKLFNNHSKTAVNRELTVEFTANPVWYAIQSLPVLSQPTDDNAISWATAYYANTLAAFLMNNQPRIKAIFENWKHQGGTKETFLSNLQKNQEVKNILLAESPWVLEAKNEEQQKERIATLFDLNNISNSQLSARTKLKELQLSDGSWPWYKGMVGSSNMTTYIATLNARLAALTGNGTDQAMIDMQTSALNYLEKETRKEYDALRKQEKEGQKVSGVSGAVVDYLYLRALSGSKPGELETYFLAKATPMLATASMQVKARLAVAYDKAGNKQEAQRFMTSLKEYLTKSEELGMYFAFNENPYSWKGQSVPAHVSVMEAFDQVSHDSATVEEMKLWLLKQKQTLQWNSPVATADAVYALLERGVDLTASDQNGARITIAGKMMDTDRSRMPGVGYVKETFTDKSTAKAKEIVVAKRGSGMGWGAVYARFEEQTDQVRQQGAELNIEKKLYVERMDGTVRRLEPVTAETHLLVGDKVVSRLTIRTDRAMEYVQLKDQRGACFEPIENLSGYRWNNGFGYYVDVKDASTNFFFDGLGKGVFVLEYTYRVDRAGTYDAGLATIQCAYAPEYSSHSSAMTVVVE